MRNCCCYRCHCAITLGDGGPIGAPLVKYQSDVQNLNCKFHNLRNKLLHSCSFFQNENLCRQHNSVMYLHPDMSEIHAIKNVENSEDCCVYLLDQITVSSLQAYLASQTINSLKLSQSPNTRSLQTFV